MIWQPNLSILHTEKNIEGFSKIIINILYTDAYLRTGEGVRALLIFGDNVWFRNDY